MIATNRWGLAHQIKWKSAWRGLAFSMNMPLLIAAKSEQVKFKRTNTNNGMTNSLMFKVAKRCKYAFKLRWITSHPCHYIVWPCEMWRIQTSSSPPNILLKMARPQCQSFAPTRSSNGGKHHVANLRHSHAVLCFEGKSGKGDGPARTVAQGDVDRASEEELFHGPRRAFCQEWFAFHRARFTSEWMGQRGFDHSGSIDGFINLPAWNFGGKSRVRCPKTALHHPAPSSSDIQPAMNSQIDVSPARQQIVTVPKKRNSLN